MMVDDIVPTPDPPPGLKEAAIRGRLIPFVGAGASMIAGCPNWRGLADGALKFFIDNRKLTHGQLEQLGSLNPRIKLAVAKSLQEQHHLEVDYRSVLNPTGRSNANGRQLYAALSQLAKTFVTTNYDEWLDVEIAAPPLTAASDPTAPPQEPPRRVIHRIEDFKPDYLDSPGHVIHLHGSLEAPAGMILTTQDYVNHYRNDRSSGGEGENPVLTFLNFLFSNRTVLFIGYSLEELEILEYVISKARQQQEASQRTEVRHYIVQGFFSHEVELMKALKLYYLACGIQLVPFLRDHKNWEQLIDVLENFAREIPVAPIMKSERLLDMEDLLNG